MDTIYTLLELTKKKKNEEELERGKEIKGEGKGKERRYSSVFFPSQGSAKMGKDEKYLRYCLTETRKEKELDTCRRPA